MKKFNVFLMIACWLISMNAIVSFAHDLWLVVAPENRVKVFFLTFCAAMLIVTFAAIRCWVWRDEWRQARKASQDEWGLPEVAKAPAMPECKAPVDYVQSQAVQVASQQGWQ